MKLYHYWRSSSSWRVRWAFALKKIKCEWVHVGLLDGESESESHLKRNPMGYVPALELPNDVFIAESLAIIHWAEKINPTPPLITGNPIEQSITLQLAELINAGTQPLQNLTCTYEHSADPIEQKRWMRFWTEKGLNAYETVCQKWAKDFSIGNQISLADLCLIPQCYNALRQELDLKKFPTIYRIYNNAIQTPECISSHPDQFDPSRI